jgi:hypothetical protein
VTLAWIALLVNCAAIGLNIATYVSLCRALKSARELGKVHAAAAARADELGRAYGKAREFWTPRGTTR